MTLFIQWAQAWLLIGAFAAGLGCGFGAALWVWLIVSRLENKIAGKADKADLDQLRNRLSK